MGVVEGGGRWEWGSLMWGRIGTIGSLSVVIKNTVNVYFAAVNDLFDSIPFHYIVGCCYKSNSYFNMNIHAW